MEVHESINGLIIPLENIDYIGALEQQTITYNWGYKIYLKSCNYIWVGRYDYRERIEDDRKILIEKLKNYNKTPVTNY